MKIQKIIHLSICLILFFSFRSYAFNDEVDSLKKALKTAEEKDKPAILTQLTWDYRNLNPDTSIFYGKQALELAKKTKNVEEEIKAYSFLGVAYRNKSNYLNALRYYFFALDLSENSNKPMYIGYSLVNIGNIYIYQKNEEAGLPFLKRAVKIGEKIENKDIEAYALLNLGRIYTKIERYDSAIIFLEKAKKLRKELKKEPEVAVCLKAIGDVYIARKNYPQALKTYNQSLDIAKKLEKDQEMISDILNQIALIFYKTGDYDEAEKFAENSYLVAEEVGTLLHKKNATHTLSRIYKKQGKYELALNYFESSVNYKEQIFNEDKANEIADLQTVYLEEKHNKEKKLYELQLKQQQYLIYTFIGGFVIVIVFLIIVFVQFRQKKKAYELLELKNIEIEKQKEKIEKQHEIVKHQKKAITDSILYASKIQNAILTPEDFLEENLPEYFILFKPRDIVSGDFYWMTKFENKLIIVAADCTGHGVPGAFMSMLGISFLSEIVSKDIFEAKEILEKLREYIITALHQTGKSGESRDGMDITLCVIEQDSLKIEFSGAYNPLIVARNKEMIEYKADKMPIGYFRKPKPFKSHQIQGQKGDVLYMFSDGFADQFGGKDGRKYLNKNFKKLLVEISDKPMIEQKQILNKTHIDWMGENHKQLDDVLVVGIRL